MLFSPQKEEIKRSFQRVKEHVAQLEKKLKENEEGINALKLRLDTVEKLLKPSEEKKFETREENDEAPTSHDESSQNVNKEPTQENSAPERVYYQEMGSPQEEKGYLSTRHRHGTDTAPTRRQPFDSPPNPENIEEIKLKLENTFKSLTRREFQVFTTIYLLEEQLKTPLTYIEIANHLGTSPSSIRDYVSELSRKQAPITKDKDKNGIIHLSINPHFRSLNLISKLLAFKDLSNEQKSLFESF